ncbi:arginine--tRNA ligase [Patescibacteria group bacterium]|nr:arginine--tRNA ligase [Patescibacteria group bacterium]
MLKKQILEDLKKAIKNLGYSADDIVISIPQNPTFGDYTTNIALQLAKQNSAKDKQSPVEIASKIISNLGNLGYLSKAEVAGGGFINFFIKNKDLLRNAKDLDLLGEPETPQKILIEYGHVNPLKEVHIGHLRTFILGESLARIFESLGHTVFRANYQGDIGLHIAKAIRGIKKLGLPTKKLDLEEKADFLGRAYAEGNRSYEEDPDYKKETDQMNTKLYQKDSEIEEIYTLTRSWSLEYFEPIYQLLGIKYDRCFFESEVFQDGKKIVLENVGKVFEKSDGAIIFPGQKYELHNRVFITSAGNPTYECKEVGLAKLEYDSFNFEKSIHVVASEQAGYFRVVFKAIEMIFPYLEGKKYHLSYGVVDLKEGKMSSRIGTVVTVDDLYRVVSEKVRQVIKQNRINIDQKIVKKVALGAIKFSYLKFSPSPNMVFDVEQSVSLEGDSGPYVQYTYARIQSVLEKAEKNRDPEYGDVELDNTERAILRQLIYFKETTEQAASIYRPNLVVSYLVELARLFNFFYQGTRIIGSQKENFRLKLSMEVSKVLKKGLFLLGIEAPEKM